MLSPAKLELRKQDSTFHGLPACRRSYAALHYAPLSSPCLTSTRHSAPSVSLSRTRSPFCTPPRDCFIPLAARDAHRFFRQREKIVLKPREAFPLLRETLDLSSLLPSQALGSVASAQANYMRVVISEPPSVAGKELLCVVRALLKKIRRRVLVGDRVLVGSVDWAGGRGMIEEAFRRDTELSNPPIANIDHLLVLFSLEQPRVEPFSLTRFLVEAESVGVPIALVVNKTDLASEEIIASWKERLQSWGYQPLFCSVQTRFGLTDLIDFLKAKTTVVVGPSGVGKSCLINIVRGYSHHIEGKVQSLLHHTQGRKWSEYQPVGSVSERTGKGRHTTRHVSLLPLPGGGYLADTPGFNLPSLLKVTTRSLAETFPEIRHMLNTTEPFTCSFRDCLHLGEPGCLIKDDWERYPFYCQLLEEIKTREEKELRTLGTKRESDVRFKVREFGVKHAEPRLDVKKHRRVSRRKLNQSMLNDFEEYLDEDS